MHIHRRVKQVCIAFVFALALGFTILALASAGTSYAPRCSPSTAAVDSGDWPEGFAVVVGINDYPGTSNDLSYCVPDARGVSGLLPKVGFTPEHVITITDSAAKKANITAEIAKLAPKMGPNDVFVLYYSGHGNFAVNSTSPGTCSIHTPHPYSNNYYNYWTISHSGALAIRVRFDNFNTESGYDYGFVADADFYGYGYSGNRGSFWSPWIVGDTCNVGLDADYIYTYYGFDVTAYEAAVSFTGSIVTADGSEMTGTEIAASLATVPAGDQYLFFDSCFSGAMVPALSKTNRSIITACRQNEYSLESPTLKHGVFTNYFLAAFSTAGTNAYLPCDTNQDNHTTTAEIFAYVEPPTVTRSTSEGYTQHPIFETRARAGAGWDFDRDHDGLFNWEEARDTDGDGLSDGEETKRYLTDPKKKDTDGDLFEDGWEVANGFNPLDRYSPSGMIAGLVIAGIAGIAVTGAVVHARKVARAPARSRPAPYFSPAPLVMNTSIASVSPRSPFAPTYHAPDAAGRLVPTVKGHSAHDWELAAVYFEQRGYWDRALNAAAIARQLRQVEMNPPRWVRDENERVAALGHRLALTAPATTPIIDSFLQEPAPEPAPAEDITLDKSAKPVTQDLQPIPAPEVPAPVAEPANAPLTSEPAPTPIRPSTRVRHADPAPEIIPLCRLCGCLVKDETCQRCGGKVCPTCKTANYATETFCRKCLTPL